MKSKKIFLSICTIAVCSFLVLGCTNINSEDKTNVEINNEDEAISTNSTNEKYESYVKNDDRYFRSELEPKSDAEEVVLDSFKILITDKYDEFQDIYVDNEQFKSYPGIFKSDLRDGLYTENVTVHSIKKLTEYEYSKESSGIKYYSYMDRLKEFNPSEFEIYEVDYTNTLSEKQEEVAQWGSGSWIRYYVVVKEKADSEWRIFDVYGHM